MHVILYRWRNPSTGEVYYSIREHQSDYKLHITPSNHVHQLMDVWRVPLDSVAKLIEANFAPHWTDGVYSNKNDDPDFEQYIKLKKKFEVGH